MGCGRLVFVEALGALSTSRETNKAADITDGKTLPLAAMVFGG